MTSTVRQELRSSVGQAHRFVFWVAVVLLGLLLIYEAGTVFYSIKSNELGVLEVLGRVTERRVPPGLHLKWPWPLSRVHRVPVKEVKRLAVDTFFQGGGPDSRASLFYRLTGLESYCLTGDNNAVEIAAVIQYTIDDPYLYVYGAVEKEEVLRDAVCREMIHLMAARQVDEVLTYGKKEIEQELRRRVQDDIDRNRTGITVSMVEIKEIRPPTTVQSYFDDVINAQVDRKKMISRAESYRNQQLPAARGERERLLRAAEAYRDQVVKTAQGQTRRFLDRLAEYGKAPGLTRRRLYFEFAREVVPGLGQVTVIDAGTERPVAGLRLLSSP